MRNLKFIIEYNGTNFFGWQRQSEKRTVQQVLEDAFFALTKEKVVFEGSGRTDKGVHALAQVATVKIEENKIPTKNFKTAMNFLLPEDVRIKKAEQVSDDFHAQFSAKRKTYRYVVQVCGDKSAIKHDLAAYYSYKVDENKMRDVAKLLIGKHNFKGFCSADTIAATFDREIFDLKISKRGRTFAFEVTGNGFLYNMVRIIAGTLLEVGRGILPMSDVVKALETGERKYAGMTMPAYGLYLKKVEY